MYPSEELNILAARKAVLLARIGVRRQQCVEAMEELTPQIAMAESLVGRWRTIASITKKVGLSSGLGLVSTVMNNAGGLGRILSFVPSLFGASRPPPAKPRTNGGVQT